MPQASVGELTTLHSPGSLAGFKGPTSKGKEERVGEIRGGEFRLPHSKFLDRHWRECNIQAEIWNPGVGQL